MEEHGTETMTYIINPNKIIVLATRMGYSIHEITLWPSRKVGKESNITSTNIADKVDAKGQNS